MIAKMNTPIRLVVRKEGRPPATKVVTIFPFLVSRNWRIRSTLFNRVACATENKLLGGTLPYSISTPRNALRTVSVKMYDDGDAYRRRTKEKNATLHKTGRFFWNWRLHNG